MQPKIIAERQFILFGMSFYGDPFDTHTGWDEDNQIGRLWKRFTGYLAQHPQVLQADQPGNACFEVHIYNPETEEKGLFEVFTGMVLEMDKIGQVPIDLSIKVLPFTKYAVFTFHGHEIVTDWEKTIQDWMTSSGYLSPFSYNFQYYDERFKGMDRLEESMLDVYVPILKAE